MGARLAVLALSVWLLSLAPVAAQNYSAQGGLQQGPAVTPDQPVAPRVPVLTPRPPQQTAPQAPFILTPQEESQVDAVLKRWEEHNREIKTFDCMFKRWVYDVVFGSPSEAKYIDIGEIKYAAPDRGAFLAKMTVRDGKEVPIESNRAEHWISDGKSIFELNPIKKQLIEHKLPPELQGKAIADGPLPFLFGAEAKKLKQRYWLRLLPRESKEQIFLEAYPKYQQDAANFSCAQFLINANDMSPYGLNLIQPNKKDHIAYQFYDVVVNDPLRLFKVDPFRPFTPLGWQKVVEEAPASQARRPPNDDQR